MHDYLIFVYHGSKSEILSFVIEGGEVVGETGGAAAGHGDLASELVHFGKQLNTYRFVRTRGK